MAYYNFVKPGSSIASLVKQQAMDQVKDTARAIAKHAEKEHVEQPAELAKQLAFLRRAVAGP